MGTTQPGSDQKPERKRLKSPRRQRFLVVHKSFIPPKSRGFVGSSSLPISGILVAFRQKLRLSTRPTCLPLPRLSHGGKFISDRAVRLTISNMGPIAFVRVAWRLHSAKFSSRCRSDKLLRLIQSPRNIIVIGYPSA